MRSVGDVWGKRIGQHQGGERMGQWTGRRTVQASFWANVEASVEATMRATTLVGVRDLLPRAFSRLITQPGTAYDQLKGRPEWQTRSDAVSSEDQRRRRGWCKPGIESLLASSEAKPSLAKLRVDFRTGTALPRKYLRPPEGTNGGTENGKAFVSWDVTPPPSEKRETP